MRVERKTPIARRPIVFKIIPSRTIGDEASDFAPNRGEDEKLCFFATTVTFKSKQTVASFNGPTFLVSCACTSF